MVGKDQKLLGLAIDLDSRPLSLDEESMFLCSEKGFIGNSYDELSKSYDTTGSINLFENRES